jgi:2-dehydro-3-deoxygluconokinase
MIKERLTGDVTRVVYYRSGGPGSRLTPQDLEPAWITSAAVLHVTGITPALSQSARETIHAAIALAREAGVTVSLDYNYRAALWGHEEAAAELRDLTAKADIVFAGQDVATLVVGDAEAGAQARAIAALGCDRVLIKLGERGAVASIRGESVCVDPVAVRAVDPVGAGDAFVAGYLAELLAGCDDGVCLQTAAACGAFAVTVSGDWEGMPFRDDLTMLQRESGTVLR